MRRRDLIVPIRDRRQRKRYLTVKNIVIVMLAGLVAFVAISIRSELRGLGPVDYGGHESDVSPQPATAPIEVVPEVPASGFVDEKLGEPTPRDPAPLPPRPMAPTVENVDRSDVAIVGGPEGVTITHRERRRPTLSGGFGRP